MRIFVVLLLILWRKQVSILGQLCTHKHKIKWLYSVLLLILSGSHHGHLIALLVTLTTKVAGGSHKYFTDLILSSNIFWPAMKHHPSLEWRHNGRDGVSNHQPHDCLLNRLFRRRTKKTSQIRVTGLGRRIHQWPVNSPHKGPCFHLMTSSCTLEMPHGYEFLMAHHRYNFWILARKQFHKECSRHNQ